MCLTHIYATAGMARVAFSADIQDYGVDGQFKTILDLDGSLVPSGIPLDYQAKATQKWRLDGSDIVYDLDARAYNNVVRRKASDTPLILILLCLPPEYDRWHEPRTDTTTLRHCCYWWSESGDLTGNTSKKTIRIPQEHIFTPEVLLDLLELERLRREGQVT